MRVKQMNKTAMAKLGKVFGTAQGCLEAMRTSEYLTPEEQARVLELKKQSNQVFEQILDRVDREAKIPTGPSGETVH